jgi:hypothetical protein
LHPWNETSRTQSFNLGGETKTFLDKDKLKHFKSMNSVITKHIQRNDSHGRILEAGKE